MEKPTEEAAAFWTPHSSQALLKDTFFFKWKSATTLKQKISGFCCKLLSPHWRSEVSSLTDLVTSLQLAGAPVLIPIVPDETLDCWSKQWAGRQWISHPTDKVCHSDEGQSHAKPSHKIQVYRNEVRNERREEKLLFPLSELEALFLQAIPWLACC